MILKSLKIELAPDWSDNAGNYEVTIEVKESNNEIKMVLPPELGEAMVNQAKDMIHEFSKIAADRLHAGLQLYRKEKVLEIES